MQITSVSNLSYQPAGGVESFAKMKQLFQNLGSALESGNLSDAKNAMAQLQKNAPAQAGNGNNPISAKIEKLSQALDSGDLKTAQDAYADIKKTMSQRPPAGGGRAGGAGGAPPNGAKQSSGASDSSSSNKVYDKKDLNKDGTVSAEEEILYSIKHPGEATTPSTTAKTDGGQGSLDTIA
jgi:hypothetical protein